MTPKPHYLLLFVWLCACALPSCNGVEGDIKGLQEQLDAHEREIQALKDAVREINEGIRSLQDIIEELRTDGAVASVIRDEQDGKLRGCTLAFGDGRSAYLRSAAYAQEETAPQIGVRSDTDGGYYWTLGGEWLLSADGARLDVAGGVEPRLRAEDGAWSVSVDGGETWRPTAQASARGGVSFQNVDTSHPDYVVITLSDGTVLQLPTWSAFVALRTRVNQLNTNLAALQTLVSALQQNDYIVSVTPFLENGEQVGWLLNLSKSGPVVLYSRSNAPAGGRTPGFGLRQAEDGVWYWTLDGEWMLDDAGQKVRASGADGMTPQLKIEDRSWWVSYDNGGNWTRLGPAVEESDAGLFREIDLSSSVSVSLVLSDGTQLVIPRYRPIELILDVAEETPIQAGETLQIPYRVVGEGMSDALVSAASDGHFLVRVEPGDAGSGRILVTSPEPLDDGYILVMLSDGNGYSTMQVVRFTGRRLTFSGEPVRQVDWTGGTVLLPFSANYALTASTDADWIHIVRTRSDMTGTVELAVDRNGGNASRVGTVRLFPEENPSFCVKELTVVQASAYFSISDSEIAAPSSGGYYTVTVASSRGCVLRIPDGCDWVSSSVEASGETYTLRLTVASNHAGAERQTVISVLTADGATLQGQIAVAQMAAAEGAQDMVLTVRANFANDFTVYLPLRGEADCFVVWGDGHMDHIDGYLDASWVSHRYAVSEPASFRVTVSGTVEQLCTVGIPVRAGIVSIDHWGDLGVQYADNAFSGLTTLTTLAPDTDGFFARVTDVTNIFSGCPSLVSLPAGLFRSGRAIRNLHGAFEDCLGLTSVPSGLLEGCDGATDFTRIFALCAGLTSVPADLFAPCSQASVFLEAFGATGLQEIPATLFAGCPAVSVLTACFTDCYALATVPVSLFDNNRRVVNFQHAFWGCDRFSGESPYTLIDGRKVHLYERKDYPDQFFSPISFDACFGNCPIEDRDAALALGWW